MLVGRWVFANTVREPGLSTCVGTVIGYHGQENPSPLISSLMLDHENDVRSRSHRSLARVFVAFRGSYGWLDDGLQGGSRTTLGAGSGTLLRTPAEALATASTAPAPPGESKVHRMLGVRD